MPEINLLKQKTNNQDVTDLISSILVKVFLVVLVGVVAYYAWLFFQSKKVSKQITDIQTEIVKNKQDALNSKQRDEVLTRQVQLQTLSSLIDAHSYFSHLLPALASATLKKATYTNIQSSKTGAISMIVDVPTLDDLDKFLQVFDVPEFNENFSQVRIGSFHKEVGKDTVSYTFDVKLQFNTGILNYDPKKAIQ